MGGGSPPIGKIKIKYQHSFTKMDQIGFQSQVAEPYDRKPLDVKEWKPRCGKAGAPVSTSSHVDAVVFILAPWVHLTAFKDAQRTRIR